MESMHLGYNLTTIKLLDGIIDKTKLLQGVKADEDLTPNYRRLVCLKDAMYNQFFGYYLTSYQDYLLENMNTIMTDCGLLSDE